MPRLKAAIQVRKETALEALRDALQAAGTNRRPIKGYPGYSAVRLAMAHWRPDFDDVPEKERKALLRAATQWEHERKSKAGPHVRVDVKCHASLREKMVKLLVDEYVYREKPAPDRVWPCSAAAAAACTGTMDECCVPPDMDCELVNAVSKGLMASPDDANSDTVPELQVEKATWLEASIGRAQVSQHMLCASTATRRVRLRLSGRIVEEPKPIHVVAFKGQREDSDPEMLDDLQAIEQEAREMEHIKCILHENSSLIKDASRRLKDFNVLNALSHLVLNVELTFRIFETRTQLCRDAYGTPLFTLSQIMRFVDAYCGYQIGDPRQEYPPRARFLRLRRSLGRRQPYLPRNKWQVQCSGDVEGQQRAVLIAAALLKARQKQLDVKAHWRKVGDLEAKWLHFAARGQTHDRKEAALSAECDTVHDRLDGDDDTWAQCEPAAKPAAAKPSATRAKKCAWATVGKHPDHPPVPMTTCDSLTKAKREAERH